MNKSMVGKNKACRSKKNIKKKTLFGIMKGTFKINGDIVAPTGEKWGRS